MLHLNYNHSIDGRFLPNILTPNHPRLPMWLESKDEFCNAFCASPFEELLRMQKTPMQRSLGDDESQYADHSLLLIENLYSQSVHLLDIDKDFREFWSVIVDKNLSRIKEKKTKIVFCEFKKISEGRRGDPFLSEKQMWFDCFHRRLADLGIPANQCIVLLPIPEIEEIYQAFVLKNNLPSSEQLVVRFCNFYEMAWLSVAQKYNQANSLIDQNHLRKDVLRPKHFLCTNNEARYHRRAFFAWLMESNLIDKGHVSFLNRQLHTKVEKNYNCNFEDENVKNLLSKFEEKYSNVSMVLDTETVHLTDYHAWPFEESYFSVITERIFNSSPGWSLPTSKIYKTIHSLHPFLILGQPGLLRALRKMGFETFPELFDESYDDIACPRERFAAVQTELVRIADKPLEIVHDKYFEILPKLIANRQHLEKRWQVSEFHAVIKTLG